MHCNTHTHCNTLQHIYIHRTEVVMKTLDPVWDTIILPLEHLCPGNQPEEVLQMYLCVCVRVCVCVHVCVEVSIYICIHINYRPSRALVFRKSARTGISNVCACACVRLCVCACACVCVRAWVCVCIYVRRCINSLLSLWSICAPKNQPERAFQICACVRVCVCVWVFVCISCVKMCVYVV